MLDADGKKSFVNSEYLPILVLVKTERQCIHYLCACVRSCQMYGSETWSMKVEHELKLNRTEMSMIRYVGLS